MKTLTKLLSLKSATCGLLIALAVPGASATDGVIKIGNLYSLTGGMSSMDVPASDGAKLAVKEINAVGGVNGKRIELVIYDTKSDPATVANVATQMIESDKVVAIAGTNDSDSTLAAGPIAQKAKVPFVAAGATSPMLPVQIGDFMFLAPFGDNVQGAVGAEFALKNLKLKTAYLLFDKSSEYANLLAKYFEDAFVKGGGKIVLRDSFKTGDKNFSAQITKLRAMGTKPDFLYISSQPDEIGTLVKQLRQSGVNSPIIGGDGYDTPLLVGVAGNNANNVYFTTHALMDTQAGNDVVKKFMGAYAKEYKKVPDNAFAALGYDSIYLIADAIKRAGSTEGDKLRVALSQTKNFKTVTGEISYPAGVRVPNKAVTVIGVKNKKLFLAAEMVPSYVSKP